MLIEMNETRPGAVMGLVNKVFREGLVYSVPDDLDDDLARVFIGAGWARKIEKKTESKDAGPAAENKSKGKRK